MANNAPPPELQTSYEQHLAASGLAPADVPSWRPIENLYDLTGDSRHRGARAIEIPYHRDTPEGTREPIVDNGAPYCRWRLLSPRTEQRYVSPGGAEPHVYVPHNFSAATENGSTVLVVTEGEKKAEAACLAGVPTVALPGVSMGFRPQEKGEARGADTPLIPELIELIERLKADGLEAIVVMFDANGAEISRRQYNGLHKDGKDEFAAVGRGKKKVYVKNPQVRREAILLADAIRKQADIATAADFVPVSIESQEVTGKNGRSYDKTLPSFPGIDDFLVAAGDQGQFELRDLVSDAAKMAQEPADEEDEVGGFIPLGVWNEIYPVWSKIQERVCWLPLRDLARGQIYEFAGGFRWTHKKFPLRTDDDEDDSKSSGLAPLNVDAAREYLMTSAEQIGKFDLGRQKTFGVWRATDSENALIVHASDGVYRVDGESCERLERCVPGRHEIYPITDCVIPDHFRFPAEQGTADDVNHYIDDIVNGWNWASEYQARMLAGWGLLQVFCCALKTRPQMFLSAVSGAGKTHLLDYLGTTFNQWTFQFADAGDVKPAGFRQLLRDAPLSCIMDEAEEQEQRADTRGNDDRAHNIRGIRQVMRASFTGKTSGKINALRGTPGQTATAQNVQTMGLWAAVGEPALGAADKTRMMRLQIRPLGAEQRQAGAPVADPERGERITRRMFHRWAEFLRLCTAIQSKVLPDSTARVQEVQAAIIAAYAAGAGLTEDSPEVADLITRAAEHHEEQQAEESDDEATNALNALCASSIVVPEFAGPKREQMKVAEVVREAVAQGLGEPGRGSGGAEGRALALHGMTARRGDGPKKYWLFVARNDPEFRRTIEPQTGYQPTLQNVLSKARGAEKSARQVKIAGIQRRGVWLPIEVDHDDQVAPTADPGAAAAFAGV